jgi:hypothetical protein
LSARRIPEDVKLLRPEEGPEIGTHGIESHVTKIEQSGETDDDVETKSQGGKYAYLKDDLKIKDIPHPDDRDDDQSERGPDDQFETVVGTKKIERQQRRDEDEKGQVGTRLGIDQRGADNDMEQVIMKYATYPWLSLSKTALKDVEAMRFSYAF